MLIHAMGRGPFFFYSVVRECRESSQLIVQCGEVPFAATIRNRGHFGTIIGDALRTTFRPPQSRTIHRTAR
ncbi:MAG: hypothetical protein MI923_20750 [Phycisphaerales bacterium]|nr:hypothetical protein [Phycisphaerales bacterium]